VYVCAELRCPTGAPIPISRPRKPTSVPSLLADARSQLSLRCSTHNAQNSVAGEGRVSQREEGCTLPVTDGFGEARPLHIDPAAKRPIASRAAAITSIKVTRVLRCIVCASYSGGNSFQLCQHSLPEVRRWSFSALIRHLVSYGYLIECEARCRHGPGDVLARINLARRKHDVGHVRSTVIVSASSYRDSRGQQKRSCVVAISVEGPSKVLQLESSCINLLPQSPADIVKERRDNAAVLHFEAIGMELLESMVVNRSPGKKRNLPHANDGGAVDAAIIVAGGLCCGTPRRHRAEDGRHPQCVQAGGCRLRGTGISSGGKNKTQPCHDDRGHFSHQ